MDYNVVVVDVVVVCNIGFLCNFCAVTKFGNGGGGGARKGGGNRKEAGRCDLKKKNYY